MSHSSKPSLYRSPQEAMKAPPEEFLYLACLHEGTGVDAPDFLAVVDAEEGRIVHESADAERRRRAPPLRLEPLLLGLPRARPLAPDRARLPLVAHPHRRRRRRPAPADIEKVIEPDEIIAKTGYTRPHTVHCMPGDNIVVSMLGDADGNGAGGFAVLDAKTFEVKGRWENGGDMPPLNYDFWYQPRKNVLVSTRVRRAERLRDGLRPRRRRGRQLRQRIHFWDLDDAHARADRSTSARRASSRSRCAGTTTQTRTRASSAPRSPASMWRFHRDERLWAAETVIEVEASSSRAGRSRCRA